MKKLMVLSLGLAMGVVGTAHANETAQAQQSPSQTNKNTPFAAIHIVDTSGKTPKLLKGNRLSRSKARQACLVLGNVPVKETNLFAEYFQAPAAIDLEIPANIAKIESVTEKKNYLISKNVTAAEIQNNQFVFCWTFTKNDPMGEYKLDAQFNDIVFKNLKFTVIK